MSMNVNAPGSMVITGLQDTGSADKTQAPKGGSLDGHSIQATDNHRAPAARTSIGDKIMSFFKAIGDGFKSIAKGFSDRAAARAETRYENTTNRLADKALSPGQHNYDKGLAVEKLIIKADTRFPGQGIEKAAEKIADSLERMSPDDRQAAIDSLRGFNDEGGMRENLLQGKADQQNAVRSGLNTLGLADDDGDAPHFSAKDFEDTPIARALTQLGDAVEGHLQRMDRKDAVSNAGQSLFDGTASAELKELFSAYAEGAHISENLDFMTRVDEFRAHVQDAGIDSARDMFNEIFDEFVKIDSGFVSFESMGDSRSINIDSRQYEALEDVRNGKSELAADALDDAFTEIESMLKADHLDLLKFVKSPIVQSYIATGAIPT